MRARNPSNLRTLPPKGSDIIEQMDTLSISKRATLLPLLPFHAYARVASLLALLPEVLSQLGHGT